MTNPSDSTPSPANGEFTTNGVPHSVTAITPFLSLTNAREALDFYSYVFEAKVLDILEAEGIVISADLDFGNGKLTIGEAVGQHGLAPQPETDFVFYSLTAYRPDVKATLERALEKGSLSSGDVVEVAGVESLATFRDPYGVNWSVVTRTKDLSDQEVSEAYKGWAQDQIAQAEALNPKPNPSDWVYVEATNTI